MFCFSCENMEPFVINCYECLSDEPEEAEIEIKVENIFYLAPTIIKVYEGNLEDNLLLETFSTSSESITSTLRLNKMYTITATYHIDGSYYTAVNSVTPRIKYDEEQCSEPCYYVYDRVINLKLKYTK